MRAFERARRACRCDHRERGAVPRSRKCIGRREICVPSAKNGLLDRRRHAPRPTLKTEMAAEDSCFCEPARRCGKPHLSPLRPRTQCEPRRPARSRPPASDAISSHGVRRIARDGSQKQPSSAAISRHGRAQLPSTGRGRARDAGGCDHRERRDARRSRKRIGRRGIRVAGAKNQTLVGDRPP